MSRLIVLVRQWLDPLVEVSRQEI